MDHESDLPSSADFARIEEQLFARINVRYRRQVIRHRLTALAAVLVIAGAGVAAGTVSSQTQQGRFAYCYGGSTTNSQLAELLLAGQSKYGSKPSDGVTKKHEANAISICSGAWSSGVFRKTSGKGPFAVPKLQVCVRDDLAVAVFRKPSGGVSAATFCNNLGLSAP